MRRLPRNTKKQAAGRTVEHCSMTTPIRLLRRVIPTMALVYAIGLGTLSRKQSANILPEGRSLRAYPSLLDPSSFGTINPPTNASFQVIQPHTGVALPTNTTIQKVRPRLKLRADPEKQTLALLFPRGLIGGFRNQAIRFSGFIAYAKQQKISQLLLPSIMWSTTYNVSNTKQTFFPIPMDMLFDIDHWNSFHEHLPVLVDSINNSDCWDVHPKKCRVSE